MSGDDDQRGRSLDVFLVAGEASGDVLGAGLMRALVAEHGGRVTFRGVGGPLMEGAGLASQFPMGDLTAIGVAAVLAKLPTLMRRLRETVAAVLARPPDILILIDAPDFTHRVARRVRKRLPRLGIVKYVSPTVWVWRPGRAAAMRGSIDLILALLPFEPDVHRELGGPPCVYVGHPLLDQVDAIRPTPEDAVRRDEKPPLVLVLPGSRAQEVRRLGAIFGEAVGEVARTHGPLDVVLPTLPHLDSEVAAAVASWPLQPRIVRTDAEKTHAFRQARTALAASGTVTLELALAGIPTVAAYRIPPIDAWILKKAVRIHPVIGVRSVILANLVLGEAAIPEFLQDECTADNLARALADTIGEGPARERQIAAFRRLDGLLGVGGTSPNRRAARAVLDFLAAQ